MGRETNSIFCLPGKYHCIHQAFSGRYSFSQNEKCQKCDSQVHTSKGTSHKWKEEINIPVRDRRALYSGVHSEEVMTRKMTKKTVIDH